MKKKRRSGEDMQMSEKLCRYLDITPDGYSDDGMIELRGRNYMMIHGRGKILSYTPEEIRIKLKGDCLTVRGKRLYCASFYKDSVGIEGLICNVSFGGED